MWCWIWRHTYKDGKNKRIEKSETEKYLEDDWIIGRVIATFTKNHSGNLKRFGVHNIGSIRITNGKVNKNIKEGEQIPNGFWNGLTRNLKK
jgi:hypothetical protein